MVLLGIAIEFCECYSKIVYCYGIVDGECRGTARSGVVVTGAAIISAFTGETTNAYVILFIILFISVLGFVQEYRAERRAYKVIQLSPINR
jgi:hypothetical protein